MNEDMEINSELSGGKGASRKKGRKLIIILIVGMVIFFLSMGAGAFMLLRSNSGDTGEKLSAMFKKEEKIASLSFKIQVNLADHNMARYLTTSIVIEYVDNDKLAEEMAEKNYRLKDAIIEVLRAKSVNDLDTGEKVAVVKKELLQAVNQYLILGKADSIYFEEFLMQ